MSVILSPASQDTVRFRAVLGCIEESFGLVPTFDLMLQEKSRTLRVEEICLEEGSPWIGKTIGEWPLRARYNLLLLALKRIDDSGSHLAVNPPDEVVLSKNSVIIVIGDVSDLRRARTDANPADKTSG